MHGWPIWKGIYKDSRDYHMKKIMFVDEHKIVNYAGGAEKVICNFSNEFIKRGYEVSIVCMDMEAGKPLYPLDEKVDFINLFYDSNGKAVFGGLTWLFKKIQKEILRAICGSKMRFCENVVKDPKKEYYFQQFVYHLRKVIVQKKPDVLISISVDGAGIIQKALQDIEIPVIAMCHTDPIHFLPEITEGQWSYWGKCSCVQVLLPVFAEKLQEKGLKNTTVIPNNVPQVADEDICKLEDVHHKIIMVGRIEGSTKRQHLIIEAFARIADMYPEWTIHIYGEIANKRYAKKLQGLVQKNNLNERVFFEGVTDDIGSCLRESDIFAFPSEYEGFSLALTEAMSVGLPVLGCTDCLSVSDLIADGENGILAMPNPVSIAEKLQLLIDSPKLRIDIGNRAHEAMKQYDKEAIYDQWENLINEMMRRLE